jgi:hypothetical protein
LDCTLESDPIAGPPRPAMPSQAMMTAISPIARSTALRRDGVPPPAGGPAAGGPVGGCADDCADGPDVVEESSAVLCDPLGMAESILLRAAR